jgi:hypothetical protein
MQPSSGLQYTTVSGGVGTTVVKASNAVLERIVIPGTYVGTLVVHNAASAAGTSTTTPIVTLGLPTTSIPQSIELGIECRSGITYEATGTPVAVLVWN